MIQITNDNDMVITDEDGNEQLAKILFYYHNDQRSADYYFLFKPETPDEVVVMASEDGNSLREVSEEEFEEAQEVFSAYEEDPLIEEARK